jgi:TolB-like protein
VKIWLLLFTLMSASAHARDRVPSTVPAEPTPPAEVSSERSDAVERRAAANKVAEEAARAQRAAEDVRVRGVSMRLRLLAERIATDLQRMPGDSAGQSFAVLPFGGTSDDTSAFGVVIADLLQTHLQQDHHLPLVERAQLKRVLDESALAQSGLIKDGDLRAITNLTATTAVVVGQIDAVGAEAIVSARVVDANGFVVATQSVKVDRAELQAFSSDAVVLRSKGGAAVRSLLSPGWGQNYNQEDEKAWVVRGAAYGLLTVTVGAGAFAAYTRFVQYPAAKADTAIDVRNRADIATLVTAGAATATALVWVFNVADAYVSGYEPDPR